MYASFFGLKQAPFSIAPDPRYLFMSERHREALAHLLYGLGGGGGFVLLTGEIGAGKTTVCRAFLEQVPPSCHVAYIFNPKLTVAELLQSVCDEFRIALPGVVPSRATVKEYIDPLNHFLLGAHAAGQQCVLVIDEAQNLSADVLEQLRLLTNLETHERKLLQIVLIGQPELRAVLAEPGMAQLAQRVIARYHLAELTEADTSAYVAHRLAVAGRAGAMPFDKAALRRIHRLSRGLPRRINLLCDRALLGAYGQGQAQVGRRIVDKAAGEVFDASPPSRRRSRRAPPRAWLSLVVLLLSALLVVLAMTVSWPLWKGAVLSLLGNTRAPAFPVMVSGKGQDAAPPSAAGMATKGAAASASAVGSAVGSAAGSAAVSASAAPAGPGAASGSPLPTAPAVPRAAASAVGAAPVAASAGPSAVPPAGTSAQPAVPLAPATASSGGAAPSAGTRLDLAALPRDEQPLLAELLPMWRLPATDADPCLLTQTRQVLCYRTAQATLPMLRALDRPGLLVLRDARGQAAYARLTRLTASQAELAAGGRSWRVPLDDLSTLWRGEFITLWQAPKGYAGVLNRDARGPAVDALAQGLAQVRQEPPPAAGQVMDAALSQRVAGFQLRWGLPPDGQAGPTTFMQLNRALAQPEPRLLPEH